MIYLVRHDGETKVHNLRSFAQEEVPIPLPDYCVGDTMVIVGYRIFDPEIPVLTQAYPNDACYDLYARERVVVDVGRVAHVDFGFALELPDGFEALVRSRSGYSRKGVLVIHGTCDSNYRGEIGCAVLNATDDSITINRGDKLAQLAIRPIPTIVLVKKDKLSPSNRGELGFGSSGF